MALDTPEHSGRVRGVGAFVTPSTYFHIPRRNTHSHCQEKYKYIETKLLEMQVQMEAMGQNTPHTPQSEHVSSNAWKSDNKAYPQVDPIVLESQFQHTTKDDLRRSDPKNRVR